MRLRISSRAYRELASTADYLNARNPHAAWHAGERIQRTLRQLQRTPYIGRESGIGDIRQFPVPRLPYLILYRVAGDTVEVVAIFHTSRDPGDKA